MPPSTLTLTNPNVCPPDGFRYVFPEDGYLSHSWTWNDLLNDAVAHCLANNYPVEGLKEKIEDQICRTLPPEWCGYGMPNVPRVTVSLSWSDIVNGAETFARWAVSGLKHVDQKEAERRAGICARCYLNVPVSGCLGCQKLVQEAVKGLASRYDHLLKGCAVCRCILKAKIHFPLNVLDKENPGVQERYPGHCWLNKSSDNYHG